MQLRLSTSIIVYVGLFSLFVFILQFVLFQLYLSTSLRLSVISDNDSSPGFVPPSKT